MQETQITLETLLTSAGPSGLLAFLVYQMSTRMTAALDRVVDRLVDLEKEVAKCPKTTGNVRAAEGRDS